MRTLLVLCVLSFGNVALAQDTTNDASPSLPSTPTSTDPNVRPSASDNANSDANTDQNRDVGGLVNYYFVFLALILGIAGLVAFMVWRRKKLMVMAFQHGGGGGALERDVTVWNYTHPRRRYWQGGWRTVETTREEGLNEHGEAPPPYIPKIQGSQHGMQAAYGPAVPLQSLSREQVGLKPPDYTEANSHRAGDDASVSTPSPASNSRTQHQEQRAGS